MPDVIQSVAGLPAFLLYFALALILVAIFLFIYTWVTPYDEWTMIRNGSTAAAISLSGALLGFILPLASAITHSVNWLDMLIWGAIALIVQLVVYFIVSRLIPHLAQSITQGGTAQATYNATIFHACVLASNGTRSNNEPPTVLLFIRAQISSPSSIDCSHPRSNHNGNATVLLKGGFSGTGRPEPSDEVGLRNQGVFFARCRPWRAHRKPPCGWSPTRRPWAAKRARTPSRSWHLPLQQPLER